METNTYNSEETLDHLIDKLIRGSVAYDFDKDDSDYDDSLVEDIREYVMSAAA